MVNKKSVVKTSRDNHEQEESLSPKIKRQSFIKSYNKFIDKYPIGSGSRNHKSPGKCLNIYKTPPRQQSNLKSLQDEL